MTEQFILDDHYFIPTQIDIKRISFIDLSKEFLILRSENKHNCSLIYKDKTYSENLKILDQHDIKISINDVASIRAKLDEEGYQELFRVHDKCSVYNSDSMSLILQWVNDSFLLMEMENTSYSHDYHYSTINEMINDFKALDLPYDSNDYFVSKAYLVYNQ